MIAPIDQLERHRVELTGFCCQRLGSLEAEDAVQETFVRAWRNFDRFEGRATLRAWLYRIATNVCADMLERRTRRPRPMDLRAARESIVDDRNSGAEATEPMFDVLPGGDPADLTEVREAIQLAFVVVLRHLPPKQRAVLILREALRWKASEVAELLDTSVASVNSALQRARATLEAREMSDTRISVDTADANLLARYVEAFASYDMTALTELIREDAVTAPEPVRKRIETRALLIAKAAP